MRGSIASASSPARRVSIVASARSSRLVSSTPHSVISSSAAPRLVEPDHARETVEADLGQRVLGRELLLLRLEDLEIVGETAAIPFVREPNRLAVGCHRPCPLPLRLGQLLIRDERRRGLVE